MSDVFDCRQNKQIPISLIAMVSGTYRLSISLPQNSLSGGGHYEARIAEIRQASPTDRHRVTADKAFAEGEWLLRTENVESRQKAVKKYEDAIQAWENAGDKKEKANVLGKVGETYFLLGELQNALNYYEKALQLYRELTDKRGEGEVLNALGGIYLSRGDNGRARQYCDQSLKIGQAIGDRRIEALSLNNIGESFNWSGDLRKAIEYYQQALPLWRNLRDSEGQAQTLTYLGYTHSDLGEPQKAIDFYKQALILWQEVNGQRGQALTLTAIGRLYSRLGESQKALDFFSQAMQLLQPLGDRIEEARTLNGIGYIHEVLGEQQRALDYYSKAINLFQAVGYRNGEASTLHEIGRAYFVLGNNQKALYHFKRFLTISQAVANRRLISYAFRDVGMIHDSEGDKAGALKYYNQALTFCQAEKDRRGEAGTLNSIGRIYHSWGRWQKAIGYYQRALHLNQAAGDLIRESLTLYNIASAERDLGRLSQAMKQVEAAVQIIESLRTKVASRELRTSYFASIQQYYELNIDLLMRQQKGARTNDFAIKALETSERGRGRTLFESLGEGRTNIRWEGDLALIEREQKLQQEINAKASQKTRLLNTQASSDHIATVIKEIAALTAEHSQVEAQIREKNPRYAALKLPQPLGAKEIQQLLDGNTLLLEFSLGEKRSYVWAITQTEVKAYELPGRAEIEKAAREVYAILAPPESAVVQSDSQRKAEFSIKAAALSKLILRPVANDLGNKRLVIVADGILQYIPFSVLPKPQISKLNGQPARDSKMGIAVNPVPLIYDHEIVNLPSASTLAVIRRETAGRKPAPKAVAVVADPVFDGSDLRLLSINGKSNLATLNQAATGNPLSQARENLTRGGNLKRLYGTLEEAKAIEELTNQAERLIAKDFDADLKRATSAELSQYRIIHFATHGALDDDNPNLSALVFSLFDKLGKPQNGYLYLHDIYNLNLPAELVVLSACDTALGKEFKGEGLVGLTRGFMYAGAPRVMASLWKVGDEPTAKLMREFYRYHLKDGLPPAAALRQAQIKLYQDADWNAPYYWGSFVLQGEWK
ncbi:MAG: CHAT domain-containing protein [Blastocatellia bacterium]